MMTSFVWNQNRRNNCIWKYCVVFLMLINIGYSDKFADDIYESKEGIYVYI